jgi:hypothetical protein
MQYFIRGVFGNQPALPKISFFKKKINIFYVLDRFDALILKIIFKK